MENILENPFQVSFDQGAYPENEIDFLKGIQGNILKKIGGGVEALIYLNFGDNLKPVEVKKLREKVSKLSGHVSSAYSQLENSQNKKKGLDYCTFLGFYLSFQGYQVLQIPIDNVPSDPSYRAGMENGNLGDPKKEEWDIELQNQIHAMFLVIDDNMNDVNLKIEELEREWSDNIIGVQYGKKLTNHHGDTIEHFGYVDGISQPLFFKEEIEKLESEKWDPSASPSLVLVKEPGEDTGYGSYLVYRKLEQNVKEFKSAEVSLAHHLGFTGVTEEVAGALIIGRFENGLPVVKFGSTADSDQQSHDNDFTYDIDKLGQRCPYHSHIRKTNPRGDSNHFFGIDLETERKHRIARRGITYDDIGRNNDLSFHPERGVGLLFICFQSSITDQFEFMQRHWANNNDFPKPFVGIDPIIGQGENRCSSDGSAAEQKWSDIFTRQQCQSLSNFVKMKGGEYFFAPSIKFLETL